jgi:hypothetical protein
MSGLLILTPLQPGQFPMLTCIAGLSVLISALPALSSAYKKPVYVFLILSLLIFSNYQLSLSVLVSGVNSMVSIIAIVAVLQLFVIPMKLGKYDVALRQYLETSFKKERSLYVFLHLVTHLLGTFLLFGTIPIVFSIFYESIANMVHDPKKFAVTSICRSYALVTLWAPGAINVILALQATGAPWLQVILPATGLTVFGILTSILLDVGLRIKNRPLAVMPTTNRDNSSQRKAAPKAGILLLVAAALIVLIVMMEQTRVLTSTTRVLAAGIIIIALWMSRYVRQPELYSAWRGYWEKSLTVVPDMAALFIAMGIFSETVDQAGLMAYLQSGLVGIVQVFGQYTLLLIPPVMILVSLTGIHPFISILLIGKVLTVSLHMPHHDVLIALSLLLGGVISYTVSPFAGNVLTLSRLSGSSPREVAFSWNGLFSLVFLTGGLLFLFILQLLWQ